jgi:hypothetical protein
MELFCDDPEFYTIFGGFKDLNVRDYNVGDESNFDTNTKFDGININE